MASRGPSSKAPAPAAKPVPKVAVEPKAAKPAAPKAAVVKPEAKPAPVAAKIAAKPVVATAPPVAPVPVVDPVVDPRPVLAAEVPEIVPEPVVPEPIVPEPAVAAAAAVIEKETVTMEATVKSAAEKVQAQAKSLFGDVNDRTRTALEKSSKAFEEFNDFSKGNVEALVESSKIAARGAEDIGKYTTDYVKATVEKANAAARQFAAVKSPTELFKLQGEHAKEALDSVMAETAKFTENYLKLLGEIAQPISNRVAIAAEKIKIAA